MAQTKRPSGPKPGRAIVLVTGPAGAGRSTAINALEDFGFEAIDNLPLSLLPRLLDGDADNDRPLAVGVDSRNREFSPGGVGEVLDLLRLDEGLAPSLLYVDCSAGVLFKRFSETRRRHPMARDDDVRVGIERDTELLASLRDQSDYVIDTTDLSPHDLRASLAGWFDADQETKLSLTMQSFSYRRGLPRGADLIFDVRFLRNPHWEPSLRKHDGRDAAVGAYVQEDALFSQFLDGLVDMVALLLPAYEKEGKSYLSIGIGCTGGQHRSVFVVEQLAKRLAEDDWQVSIRHRELELRGRL